MNYIKNISLALCTSLTLTACDEETLDTVLTVIDYILSDDGTTIRTSDGTYLGWLEEDEHTETIEDDIDLNGTDNNLTDDNLPTKVDLSKNLPRIGDQGQYGTCVAWATAYNCRTWLYAKTHGLTTNQLTDQTTFSPADVFMAIDNQYKGSNCGGTNFRYAFDVMQQRGVATQSDVPYASLDCSCYPSKVATTAANNYKIKAYREINIRDINTIKRYLANGRLVVFGAKLGDEFMYTNDATVLTKQTTFKSTGQHGYHAMVCSGYDDNKGSNGAFRVVNSWGTSWGDNGYIWVDYKFFTSKEFAYTGFVAYGMDEDIKVDDNVVVNTTSGYDIVPLTLSDIDYDDKTDPDSEDATWRSIIYNVYNAGNQTITPEKPWAICYVLYNAYNAGNYQIVLLDLYTDAFGTYTNEDGIEQNFNPNWDENIAKDILGINAQGYCWSNVSVKGGESVSHAVYGNDDPFEWTYKMPNITGSYYLVLIADAFNGVSENNEDNNYYFLTTNDGKPLNIENGIIRSDIKNNKALKMSKVREQALSPSPTAVTPEAPNTYTPAEISAMLNAHRKSGELTNKALAWYNSDNGRATLAKKRKLHISK